jgi:hypothetical protein
MKMLIVFATLAAGFAVTQQASACEWMKQAAKPATVVTCEDGTCTAEQTQTLAAAATTETAPAAAQTLEDAARPSPTVVASEH